MYDKDTKAQSHEMVSIQISKANLTDSCPKFIRHQYCGQFSAKGAGETPQTMWHINRYSGLGSQEIRTAFRGMHYSAVTKASARLETEMTHDKGVRNLVREIVSNTKTEHPPFKDSSALRFH
jgi:hypothetical protein